jgi:hypothetical protein
VERRSLTIGNHSILLLEEELAASSDGTGSLGGNETALLTARGVSSGRCGVTHVLMVTTTVRMLDGVHGDTSDSGPVSLLGVRLVVATVGAEHRLVGSLAASDDTNHGSAASEDGLADTRWKSDTGLFAVFRVTNDDGGGARGTGERATVTKLCLEVGYNSALWHRVNGENVSDSERGFGATIDELAGVHAFDSDEKLSVLLEFVLVSENNLGKRGATAGVVHNVLHDSLDVSSAFHEVQGSESCGCDSL